MALDLRLLGYSLLLFPLCFFMLAAGLFFRYNLDNPWGYIVLAVAVLVWVGWTKLIYRARKKSGEGTPQ